MRLEEAINCDAYSLTDTSEEALDSYRRRLSVEGVCVLPQFLCHEAVRQICLEATSTASLAYHSTVTGNAYLNKGDVNYPDDHPLNRTDETSLGVVAYDQIPKESLIRKIYESQDVLQFVSAIIGRGKLYYYDCPLGALNFAVMTEGEHLRWHFDQSDFVVSIALQDCEMGGKFEYVPNLRSNTHPNYERVRATLDGSREGVEVLSAPPGSLILFEGMNTLHRVTEVKGTTPRIVALLGYADAPEVRSSPYLQRLRYGRDAPATHSL